MFHIVDDSPYLGNMLREMLASLGHKSEVFSCPLKYIAYANTEEFSMPIGVITDADMPAMNGYEMMKELHCIYPSIKFIVATSDPYIDHSHKEKACMFIRKPFRYSLLANIIQKISCCLEHGASDNMGCGNCDEKDSFYLANWACPHS